MGASGGYMGFRWGWGRGVGSRGSMEGNIAFALLWCLNFVSSFLVGSVRRGWREDYTGRARRWEEEQGVDGDGVSDEYGRFSWLVEMVRELVSDPLMARTWAEIPLSGLVPLPCPLPCPIQCPIPMGTTVTKKKTMRASPNRYVPNIGVIRELTLDRQVHVIFSPSRQPYSPVSVTTLPHAKNHRGSWMKR